MKDFGKSAEKIIISLSPFLYCFRIARNVSPAYFHIYFNNSFRVKSEYETFVINTYCNNFVLFFGYAFGTCFSIVS